jgi:hypothetical protein
MTDDDDYCREQIRASIRSGFATREDVHAMLDDILEDAEHEDELRDYINVEFEQRFAEEATWPSETDCDRIDRVFGAMPSLGIVAIQRAGYTMSDGHHEVDEALASHPPGTFKGYCFYHEQDVQAALETGNLRLAFGDLEDTVEGKVRVGKAVRDVFVGAGFECEWAGDANTRIVIKGIDWKRRMPRD